MFTLTAKNYNILLCSYNTTAAISSIGFEGGTITFVVKTVNVYNMLSTNALSMHYRCPFMGLERVITRTGDQFSSVAILK